LAPNDRLSQCPFSTPAGKFVRFGTALKSKSFLVYLLKKEKRLFFFEKKNQKTFDPLDMACG